MNFRLPCISTFFIALFLILLSGYYTYGQILKSLVYDFDGLDISQTNLPEGDFSRNDLSYQIAANPLSSSDMLGDRVIKMNINWNAGYGTFGRGISRFIEFNVNQDKINFYFYNPISNNQIATLDVLLADDDDKSNTYDYSKDDAWKKSIVIPTAAGWQFLSIPLNDFIDSNPGGNGIFDIAFTQNKGMLLQVEFRFNRSTTGLSNPVFYMDMINFSEGEQPRGATVFDLPPKDPAAYCLLGAYNPEGIDQVNLIPPHIESLFPVVPGKKLKYANFFLQWAMDGSTVAKALPGNAVQTLLDNGYTPIITWEPQFQGYTRLDPVQPRLNNIINGDYNSYIDAFATKIKTYTGTVIIRFMHEFEGNWYPWSIVHNNQDPSRYVTAFRTVVDRFRAKGVTNVQWMWCVNSDYFPYLSYNWIVPAYPGDNYVDIVATDIYNNHYPENLPWWKSFRWQATESYYYLTKYFPQKPLYICEVGCRERKSQENSTSQSKGDWYAQMDKELQTDFQKARALVFFNGSGDQNWKINSSTGAINSLINNIWYDDYYFKTSSTPTALTVIITSPSNNSFFNVGENISLQANVSGGTPPILKVEFFADTTKLGEDQTFPYSFAWNNVSQGNYELTAKATDNVNNTITSSKVNITVSPVVSCSATGTISVEIWNNISGTMVSDIPLNVASTTKSQLSGFETATNINDNYGQRIRGYVCPPSTGNYIFWISSDDNSELWLSTNNDPANKFKIASVSGWTSPRQWTKYATQQSASKYLIAGQKYYIEALHKEGAIGDNFAVGWQLPSGAQERPIPGNRLSPFDTITPTPLAELIAAGSAWRYLDNGSNQGTAWRSPTFNDATWKTGNAELGYGDGGETTVVSYGPSSTNKYITTYFRKTFNVIDKSTISGLELSLIRDDGAVVYINGVEVYKNNLPPGIIYYNTLAPIYIDGTNETTFSVANISSSSLVNGSNVIAVEIHQNAVTSSDVSFNLRLKTLSGSRIMDTRNENDSIAQTIVFENNYDMIVYPNPNTGQFNLELCIDDLQEKNVLIEVTNSFGKVVHQKQAQKINGCVKEAIELDSSLPVGVYILKVTIDDTIQTSRMLLAR